MIEKIGLLPICKRKKVDFFMDDRIDGLYFVGTTAPL